MLQKLRVLPPDPGTMQALAAASGFMSEANVRACATPEAGDAAPIAPLIALSDGFQPINTPLQPVGSAVPRIEYPCVHTDR